LKNLRFADWFLDHRHPLRRNWRGKLERARKHDDRHPFLAKSRNYSRGIFATEVEVDERYVRQAFSHKFRGFCRCRCRSGYVGPQKLKVLF
jgi:hypothetical protein